MTTTEVPCRLFVILARKAEKAIIFRQGPNLWTQLILWDTATDTFEYGQWFKGHVYRYRCDLSPDGSLLIYFVSKFNRKTLADKEYTYAWTAISKPPYFTALALWPKGDCWHGGGLFKDQRTVLLNHRSNKAKPHPKHLPHGLTIIPNDEAHGEDFPIYLKRLERDGWKMIQQAEFERSNRLKFAKPYIWEKVHSHSKLVMLLGKVRSKKPGGWAHYEFSVMNLDGKTSLPVEGATWADWDHCGRLVYVKDGQLLVFNFSDTPASSTLLADFNPQKPTEVVAPDWAKNW